MNNLLGTILLLAFTLSSLQLGAVNQDKKAVSPAESTEASEELVNALKDYKDFKVEKKSLNRKDRKAKRKQVKQNLKAALKSFQKANSSGVDLGLLVIITILLPPVGMVLHEGSLTGRFWISLLLTLLFYIPGLVYSLIVILSEN